MGKSDKTKDEGAIASDRNEEIECCADGACCWDHKNTSARPDKEDPTDV